MNDDSEISDPHFFDVLKQPVYVGDVCLTIGTAHYDALMPVLIKTIEKMRQNRHYAYRVIFKDPYEESEYQLLIMKDENDSSDQFIKVQNPEFFVDSDPMAKILAKQSDLKNDLKR